MASKYLTIEEFHLSFRVSSNLNDAEANEVQRDLNSNAFIGKLRRAIGAILNAQFPHVAIRVRISQ